MRAEWKVIKNIIGESDCPKDKFISLIAEDGTIVSANARMVRTLHLKPPKSATINFFDLLHPLNKVEFREGLKRSIAEGAAVSLEAYLKNGYYHPMKWQVSPLVKENKVTSYLCIGHKLLDDERLQKFNKLGAKNYQLIVESLNAGILFQDSRGELIAVNQKSAEIFNTTLERLYQLTDIANLWNTAWEIRNENGDPVPFENTPFMKALQTGKTQTEVLLIRLKNGDGRWLHFSSQPLFDENSSAPFAVLSNIADLTYERNLIRELKERKAILRSFLNQTPNLAWVVDEHSTLIFASKSFYQYFGLNEVDSLNKNITDLVPPSVAAALYEKHIEVLETGKPAEIVEKAKWADGTDFIFHINIFPIEGISNKKILGGHAVNLTDKHAIEKKLREANDRLLLLTRATSDAIWEWDMQTGYIFRNDALMDMIGYQSDTPKGLSWWLRRIHPDDRNRVGDKVKESTDTGKQSWEDEYRFKCADGNYKHMRDKGYIVYENGLPIRMIGSLQDVTGLKDLECQLMEEKLERQKEVSEMVIRSQEMEKTKIGHELHDNVNQILSTTKLFIEMINPSGKDQSDFKAKGIAYISLAIEEIRKLSKELAAPHLKNNGLVESIKLLIDDIHLSTSLSVKLVHDHDADLLSSGKKVTLFRIVQEQLKNIIKHSQATKVDISLQRRENHIELVIKDNGIGFDSKQTRRGIGLSNIYERVRFYDGTADIKTAPSKGCTLTASIPSLG